jgi:serine/threonine protein kinase
MPARVTTDSVIAGFRVQSLIGAGSMGSVYLAEDTRTGERVALKVMAAGLAEDERFRRRFTREAALAAALDHPHIVRTVASGEADGLLFLAMALVEGSDLREVLRREGRLEPERALQLVAQAADALDAAHAAGLVHRDVKPGNILIALGPEGEHAYVCDFGLARHVSSVSSLTGERGFVGTIDYVPPEQIQGGAIDSRTDVYSLGCVLFECLAGARPFERESELSVVFAHLNEPPPRLSELRPELPAAFDDVFATALAKVPGDRYATCGELAEAASAAARGKVLARPKSRRRGWVASAATLAAAGAALGGFLTTRGGDNPGSVSPTGLTEISQTAIAGTKLGQSQAYYKRLLGGYRQSTLAGPEYPTLTFQQPQMAVYFATDGAGAIIITTWNRDYRTDRGIGPCSKVTELKKAYGSAVKASDYSQVKDGIATFYVVGSNLLFATQRMRTISAVALYRGPPLHTGADGVPESFAGFVASDETACVSG